MTAIITLIVGFLLGAAVFHRRPMGNLRIDRSDPTDPPYLFLELSSDVGRFLHKKYVVLRVRAENFLPHE